MAPTSMATPTQVSKICCLGLMSVLLLLAALAVPAASHRHSPVGSRKGWMVNHFGRRDITSRPYLLNLDLLSQSKQVAEMLRGGAEDESSTDDEEEEESDEEYEQSDDEEEEVESEYDEQEEEDDDDETSNSSTMAKSEEYDEPYFMTPTMTISTTIFCMVISKKFDTFSSPVVRFVRFLFVLQIASIQLFVLYVRVMAKKKNDRTPVEIENPISGMLKTQLDQGGNAMVKNLASSFLSSSTTIMEYDMRQANSMQGTIIFTMAFMWLLHFKMNMVQPLVQQIVTGFLNLFMSPLFQVYVLGRNLERPFKTPVTAAQKMAELNVGQEVEAGEAKEDEEAKPDSLVEENEDESESEDGDDSDDEDSESSDDDDGSNDDGDEGEGEEAEGDNDDDDQDDDDDAEEKDTN